MEINERIVSSVNNETKVASKIIFVGTVFVLARLIESIGGRDRMMSFIIDMPRPFSAIFLLILFLVGFFSVIFLPIYFIVLSLRYYREKSQMYILDKITFYILFIYIASIAMQMLNII